MGNSEEELTRFWLRGFLKLTAEIYDSMDVIEGFKDVDDYTKSVFSGIIALAILLGCVSGGDESEVGNQETP